MSRHMRYRKRKRSTRRKGFTLVEFLISIAIIGILMAIVIVAVNPAKQLAETRNAKRYVEVLSLADALQQYVTQHPSGIPNFIDTSLHMIGTSADSCTIPCGDSENTEANCVDLTPLLVSTYLNSIPYDPRYGDAEQTHYAVLLAQKTRFEIRACGAELGESISIVK